jgi:hypothetical protein
MAPGNAGALQRGYEPGELARAYHQGGVLPRLAEVHTVVENLIRDQLGAGNWPDYAAPATPSASSDSGSQIDVRSVTANAVPVLEYAAITGDSDAAGAGLRALEFLERELLLASSGTQIAVPGYAGALADVEAGRAYLLGYQISGNRRYLERARQWADTALAYYPAPPKASRDAPAPAPAAPGDPAARPGLVRLLHDLQKERPDRRYAEAEERLGKTGRPAEPRRGERRRRTRDDRPAAVVDPSVSHRRIRVGPDRLFVASGAEIRKADSSAMRLRLDLEGHGADATYTTVTGVPVKPMTVEYDTSDWRQRGIPVGRSFLPETDKEGTPGWHYDPEARLLILYLPHRRSGDHLEIRWPDPRERTPIDRVDTKVRLHRQ